MAAAALDIPKQAQQWTVVNFPAGLPEIQRDFAKKTVDLHPDSLQEGQVLVKTSYVSVDPFQRIFLSKQSVLGEREVGDLVTGSASGVVVASKNPKFPVGVRVEGNLGWVTAAVVQPEAVQLRLLADDLDAAHAVGALGMPGITAMYGVDDVLKPEAGQTVFVSGAAGAVGSLVGQICKALGCKVYGSAGSDEKVQQLLQLGFDGGVNYSGKTAEQLIVEIKQLLGEGEGIDRYFENTGGPVTGAVFALLKRHARVAVCGQISLYNVAPEQVLRGVPDYPSNILLQATTTACTIQGFHYVEAGDWNPYLLKLQDLMKSGKVKVVQTLVEGFDNIPEAFMSLFKGANRGKLVVKF